MDKRLSFYKLVSYFCVFYILYALANTYVVDPGAETFLSHKTDLPRELKTPIWLLVMYSYSVRLRRDGNQWQGEIEKENIGSKWSAGIRSDSLWCHEL
ncbi:hypothetical protein [Paenibacillus mendelii]|uniref:Uncharacterized protein n=1 Tax=Paenibacillus mendelii TaxID=206163 RepID=A0ABV6J2D2_9BACL|nr:hypothetical protein [Paenibacillus mendelii]MCQ6563311.1 hypothetical protein [Paenibacillus mendelii]